jgi:hypothetical protein
VAFAKMALKSLEERHSRDKKNMEEWGRSHSFHFPKNPYLVEEA